MAKHPFFHFLLSCIHALSFFGGGERQFLMFENWGEEHRVLFYIFSKDALYQRPEIPKFRSPLSKNSWHFEIVSDYNFVVCDEYCLSLTNFNLFFSLLPNLPLPHWSIFWLRKLFLFTFSKPVFFPVFRAMLINFTICPKNCPKKDFFSHRSCFLPHSF